MQKEFIIVNWIISANSKIYDHKSSFLNHGYIDWHQVYNFSVGDIVYIYSSKPDSKITFKTRVDKINLKHIEVRDDKDYWKDVTKYNSSKNGLFCKLTLLECLDNENLSLKHLLGNGLKSPPQGAVKLKGSLLDYIETITNSLSIDDNLAIISKHLEGSMQQILTTRYERNIEARQECIKYHGLSCQVCGLNFLKTYGNIGSDFIHVHHIIPISSIKKDYVVDPIKDLITVCPNCHAMLHKRVDNRYLSVEELKQIVILNKQ